MAKPSELAREFDLTTEEVCQAKRSAAHMWKYIELAHKVNKLENVEEIKKTLPKTDREHYEFLEISKSNHQSAKKKQSWAYKYYLLKWQVRDITV